METTVKTTGFWLRLFFYPLAGRDFYKNGGERLRTCTLSYCAVSVITPLSTLYTRSAIAIVDSRCETRIMLFLLF